MCNTSAPTSAGRMMTWAFILARCPWHTGRRLDDAADVTDAFFIHAVGGRVVIISAPSVSLYCSALAFRSAISTRLAFVGIHDHTRIPAMWAVAGLVPWAERGIRHTLRLGWP